MTDVKPWRVLARISGLLFVLAAFWGCAGSGAGTRGSDEGQPYAGKPEEGPVPLYYEFEDVLVPAELKVDKARSFLFQSTRFRAGLLVVRGRVETASLTRFFEKNMPKDNWRPVSSFKSKRTIMFFNKPNRICIISIEESGLFSTEAEIWVAPAMESSEETLLK